MIGVGSLMLYNCGFPLPLHLVIVPVCSPPCLLQITAVASDDLEIEDRKVRVKVQVKTPIIKRRGLPFCISYVFKMCIVFFLFILRC